MLLWPYHKQCSLSSRSEYATSEVPATLCNLQTVSSKDYCYPPSIQPTTLTNQSFRYSWQPVLYFPQNTKGPDQTINSYLIYVFLTILTLSYSFSTTKPFLISIST